VRVREMIVAGARAVRARPGLVTALFAVKLILSLLFAFAVARTLGVILDGTSFLPRAVHDGDVVAALTILEEHGDILTALLWCGVALAVAYGIASFYLTGGLLAALRGGRFADGAGTWFFPFVRLWAFSLPFWLVALFFTFVGFGLATARLEELPTVDWFDMTWPALLGALPGLLMCCATSLAVDYARAIMVAAERRSAVRALLAGYRIVFTSLSPSLHYLAYLAAWLGVTFLYTWATWGTSFSGAAGLLALFALRQLVSATRFLARVTTYAGQLHYITRREVAPRA
jgi:hypothetical protein